MFSSLVKKHVTVILWVATRFQGERSWTFHSALLAVALRTIPLTRSGTDCLLSAWWLHRGSTPNQGGIQ